MVLYWLNLTGERKIDSIWNLYAGALKLYFVLTLNLSDRISQ